MTGEPDGEHAQDAANTAAHVNPWHLNIVYGSIADSLPQEGRDYKVSFDVDDGGNMKTVSLSGLTPLGDAWVPHAMEMLRARIAHIKEERSANERR